MLQDFNELAVSCMGISYDVDDYNTKEHNEEPEQLQFDFMQEED